MTTAETSLRGGWDVTSAVASVLLVIGLGLVSWGTYWHLTIAEKVQTGRCDACSPWHPLIIVAPLVVGSAAVLIGGYILYRR